MLRKSPEDAVADTVPQFSDAPGTQALSLFLLHHSSHPDVHSHGHKIAAVALAITVISKAGEREGTAAPALFVPPFRTST